MARYVMHKKPGVMNGFTRMIMILLIIGLIAGVVGIRSVYNRNLEPISSSQRSVLVTIAPGTGVAEIAQQLEERSLIRSAWAFEWYVRNSNTRHLLQAGSYNIRPNQSVPDIVTILTQGDVARDLFTILPGQRLDQVRSALINNGGYSEGAVDAALKPENYTDEPALTDKPSFANLEGYIYPDSYEKTTETTPEEIIRKSLDEMHTYLTPDIREAIIKQGLTVHEGVTLASIVLQEVGDPDDMRVVAQVFYSRLSQDMPLESDVTNLYGALKAGQEASLTYESDYNTYTNKGLPPGPISNVTKEALQAVAHPANTDYLFFVAGDDGKTYFSRTLAEHERLTDLHCKKNCSLFE